MRRGLLALFLAGGTINPAAGPLACETDGSVGVIIGGYDTRHPPAAVAPAEEESTP